MEKKRIVSIVLVAVLLVFGIAMTVYNISYYCKYRDRLFNNIKHWSDSIDRMEDRYAGKEKDDQYFDLISDYEKQKSFYVNTAHRALISIAFSVVISVFLLLKLATVFKNPSQSLFEELEEKKEQYLERRRKAVEKSKREKLEKLKQELGETDS